LATEQVSQDLEALHEPATPYAAPIAEPPLQPTPPVPPASRTLSPEYVSARILKILGNMARAGLLKRDTRLNAFVRHQVTDPSRARLERLLQLDRKLVDLLATEEPDPEGWMPLSLRLLNQRLCDAGLPSSMEALRSLLKSLSEDGRGFAGGQGSIELRYLSRDSYRVRVRRSWSAIAELAEKRRRVAILVLDTLLARIPDNTPPQADLLVEFSLEELQEAVERDLLLRAELKDRDAALERALMYLHEQQVIVLQQGLAVFRSAMTIRLRPDAQRERYQTSDYRPLADHYRERVLQVHVMSEYARRGLEAVREALSLVLAYFALGKEEFVRRFLGTKPELLEHATTARSFQRIVTDLANPAQIRIVSAPVQGNHLILAGPGSGKTRTVVHRCAYLLRVERVRPSSVLVCCFNRNAALELRKRLADLVGNDARGVTVVTYHALAMRLLGRSFAVGDPDFPSLITDAVKLLRGETTLPGSEPDEVRDRLLAGFEHILVDEYQDIDEPQYELISALAGRTLRDTDRKLSILAVGDDDQNIYSFRGTNVEFIRRFAQDYDARVHYLVENYRSTRHIIEAANQLIAANHDRMKTPHPIRIDARRARLPAGGESGARDPLTHGRVQVLEVGGEQEQALAAMAGLHRLRALGVANWSEIAVLSRTHRELGLVRALAERDSIPVRWCASRDALPPLHQIREIRRFLDQLEQRRRTLLRANDLPALLELPARAAGPNPWVRFIERLIEAWRDESGDAELPAQEAIEFIYEACAEGRRDFSYGEGVTLSTVHAAKGTEYPHVILTGAWRWQPDPAREEELRRVFYVGMTRARDTLTILDRLDPAPSPPQTAHLAGPAILRGRVDPATLPSASDLSPRSYTLLRLEDLYLSYAGNLEAQHPVHAALAALQPGDRLRFVAGDLNLALVNADGLGVARLSRKAEQVWRGRLDTVRDVRLVAMIQRRADQDDDADRREQRRVAAWEVPLVEVTSVFP
jgi:ATP-dependent DNA helicase RecQ